MVDKTRMMIPVLVSDVNNNSSNRNNTSTTTTTIRGHHYVRSLYHVNMVMTNRGHDDGAMATTTVGHDHGWLRRDMIVAWLARYYVLLPPVSLRIIYDE